jgi:hypothetical protein
MAADMANLQDISLGFRGGRDRQGESACRLTEKEGANRSGGAEAHKQTHAAITPKMWPPLREGLEPLPE